MLLKGVAVVEHLDSGTFLLQESDTKDSTASLLGALYISLSLSSYAM